MLPSKKLSTLREYTLLSPNGDEETEDDSTPLLPTNYLLYHYLPIHLSKWIGVLAILLLFSLYFAATFSHLGSSKFILGNDLQVFSFNASTVKGQNGSLPGFHPSSPTPPSVSRTSQPPPNYSKYLLQTPTCVVKAFPVFNNDTRPLYSAYKSKEFACPPADDSIGIRRVNFTWVQLPSHLHNCTAIEIEREPKYDGAQFGRSFPFGNQTILNFPQSDAVQVTCQGGKVTRIIPLIPVKTSIWAENNTDSIAANLHDRPNILAIGLDSISRLNYLRHLNETNAFIQSQNFEGPLYGLHKVGDNTFPNLIAMFTGISQWDHFKTLPKSQKLDGLPIIFKEFSAAGYLTTYIENMPKFGLWTYHQKTGFLKKPIEYWMRPVNLNVYQAMKGSYCYKEKLEMELYYDYIYDQMRAFRERDQRFLTFIHMAAVTHDYMNYAQYADLPMKRLLTRIFNATLQTNTMILFYSDHGLRFGSITRTESGFHESRMPFMYFYIPDGMKLKDSTGTWMNAQKIKEILRINTRRLTSQFDVHATLKHLLAEAPPTNETIGHSFFTPIPLNRTCENAGIPDDYCLCQSFVPFNDTTSNAILSSFLIEHLNTQLRPFADKCVPLELGQVLQSKVSTTANVHKNSKTFVLKILTLPNKGTIETTLRAQANETTSQVDPNGSIQITGTILRLDLYRSQSLCVAGTPVEAFCFCRDLLPTATTTARSTTVS